MTQSGSRAKRRSNILPRKSPKIINRADLKGRAATDFSCHFNRHRGFAFRQAARSAWARLIKQVYERASLACPHGGGEMQSLAVIKCRRVQYEAYCTG